MTTTTEALDPIAILRRLIKATYLVAVPSGVRAVVDEARRAVDALSAAPQPDLDAAETVAGDRELTVSDLINIANSRGEELELARERLMLVQRIADGLSPTDPMRLRLNYATAGNAAARALAEQAPPAAVEPVRVLNPYYVRDLRQALDGASPGALAICRARHGETFGQPGHGGVVWVSGEITRAEKEVAARALDAQQGEAGLREAVRREERARIQGMREAAEIARDSGHAECDDVATLIDEVADVKEAALAQPAGAPAHTDKEIPMSIDDCDAKKRPTPTYRDLLDALLKLTPEQLAQPTRWMGEDRGGSGVWLHVLTEDHTHFSDEYIEPISVYVGTEDEAKARACIAATAGTPILEID